MVDASEDFKKFLMLSGHLGYMWTNTESLLIHLIAGLSGTDKDTAVVIFLTLNTTRARIDLVERLAKMDHRPDREREDVLSCTSSLSRLSAVRNRLNHCIYSFDAENGNAQTILMRIADRKTNIRMGKAAPIDADEIGRIERTLEELSTLNRRLWQVTCAHGYPV